MKKFLLALLLLVLVSFAIYASSPDYKFAIGVKGTGLDIEMNKHGKSDLSSTITLNLDTEFDMFFKDGLGMNILFATEKFEAFAVGVGFAYNLDINQNWDFVITVGPTFGFANDVNTLGLFAHFDFDFIAGKYFFARLGTGMDLDYLTYGDGDAEAGLDMIIPVPRVSIGWKF